MSKDSATNHLLTIATAARNLSIDRPFIDGWKILFDISDTTEAYRKIGLVYKLIDVAAQEVLVSHPEQLEAVNHWRSQLYTGMQATSAGNWLHFIKYIDVHSINYLRLQASLVHLTIGEMQVDRDDLIEAKNLLIQAIDEIGASHLGDQTKIMLIKRIRCLITAIEDYWITGNDAIFDQFKATVYDLAANSEIREKGLGEKLSQAAEILANVVTSASGIQQLIAPTLKLLGIGK